MSDLLQIHNVSLSIQNDQGMAPILQGVDLTMEEGQIRGLIGESGCGKTMLSRVILGLTEGNRWDIQGSLRYQGVDLMARTPKERRAMAGSGISYISQDPLTALNPLYTVGEQIAEMLRYHRKMKRRDAMEEAARQLEKVGISPGKEQAKRYPHQFSGGQLQRICIAMAICCGPQLLIADEPTTALDVTTQAQILKLLRHLNEEEGLAILLITHDFGVVAQICQRVSVMEKGRIIEEGATEELFRAPREAYTARLIESALRKEMGENYGRTAAGGLPFTKDI